MSDRAKKKGVTDSDMTDKKHRIAVLLRTMTYGEFCDFVFDLRECVESNTTKDQGERWRNGVNYWAENEVENG